jgi:hypothetical protein
MKLRIFIYVFEECGKEERNVTLHQSSGIKTFVNLLLDRDSILSSEPF